MSNPFKIIVAALTGAVAFCAAAAAQQPRIDNASITVQTAASPLAQSFRALVAAQSDIAWIGYAVPVADRDRVMCCFGNNYISGNVSGNACCGVSSLENSSGTTMSSRTGGATPSGAV